MSVDEPRGADGSAQGASRGAAAGGWRPTAIGRVSAPLRKQVLDIVRREILDFRLRPGERLIERELMERLGVSRATVREVVVRLESEGLVTTVPQRGAIVTVLTVAEAADIYELRVVLEMLAARRFVERATDEQVRRLRQVYDDLAALSVAPDDTLGMLRAKDAFYAILLEGAASPVLTWTLTGLQSRVRLLRGASLSVPGRAASSLEEIHAIVRSVEARDAEAAAEASATHIRNAARIGLARMSEEPPPADPSR
ncbi:GntR family transcriptional regulator [Actinacidiphila acididurans]|uniref:GntR family transcriptional regulator n=1 Tax=Actinacidiphila acididurans TaxID=2784346 RepID=A0ABS2U0K5_9ACTN|nr:GntR family transcriptional regulator [Actinacidiphila acididurans]MBM9509124.1 GntR family transcriptional regulator [Actinacidiphila acididurans]